MDYKKIVPSRELRLKILKLTDFIPDSVMIRMQYKLATGRRLNLKTPKRFTEKLQWYKLYYRDPLMTQCVDKYEVRKYVSSRGYEEILIPEFGVFDSSNDIDFEVLPNRFVLKTSNGSHTNLFCNDKSRLDINAARKSLDYWLTKKTVKAGREWPYYNVKPRIICEKYLENDKNNELIDYKFICFGGKVEWVFVNADRNSNEGMRFGIYDREFKHLPYRRKGLRDTDSTFSKPLNYEKMIEIAESLSEKFPHVRIDLYNLDGYIYFGEMTFFHGSGYVDFDPDEFDFILGEKFILSK